MSKTVRKPAKESDNSYFLKILIYAMLGLVWIKINGYPVIPLGLLFGLLISSHDHFAIDRKVEYGILILTAILGASLGGFWLSLWFN